VEPVSALEVLTYFKDSEHPNDAGYSLMAKTWYPAIQGVLP
jgi:lysophospholipase L1-like esterase